MGIAGAGVRRIFAARRPFPPSWSTLATGFPESVWDELRAVVAEAEHDLPASSRFVGLFLFNRDFYAACGSIDASLRDRGLRLDSVLWRHGAILNWTGPRWRIGGEKLAVEFVPSAR